MSRRPALGTFALIGETFRLLRNDAGFLFPVAFVPALALASLASVAGLSEPVPLDPLAGTAATGAGTGALILAALVEVLVGFVVLGAMCFAAIDALLGHRQRLGTYVRRALHQSAPMVTLGTLLYLLAGIGLVLFVVPGLYVLARFLPWIATMVFEDAGWNALSRAQDLTEGYRWPLVGALVLISALFIAVGFALAPLIGLAASAGVAVFTLLDAAATAFYYALVATFTAVVYMRLRLIQENTGKADIAAALE